MRTRKRSHNLEELSAVPQPPVADPARAVDFANGPVAVVEAGLPNHKRRGKPPTTSLILPRILEYSHGLIQHWSNGKCSKLPMLLTYSGGKLYKAS